MKRVRHYLWSALMIRLRKYLIRPSFSSAALTLFAFACVRNSIETDLRGAVVRIEPDSVLLERTAEVTRFRVNVIVRNDRPTPLYFGGCGPAAQEEINGKWETVWSPACISNGSSTVAPGDSLMFPFTAARFAGQNIYPRLDSAATPGRYRLELGTIYSGPSNYGTVYRGPGPAPAAPKILGILRSPVFIVYSR
jgi:hypothetical protein